MTATARLIAPLEIKAAGNAGEVEGWASVFGNRDSQGDHVRPGAFTKSVAAISANGKGLAMLWQHMGSDPVGVWHTVREEAKGLYVKGKMLGIETDIGRYRYELVKGGAVNGLSIGYSDSVRTKRKDGGFDLVGLTLWETSLVTFPSNSRALLTGVKRGADDFQNPRVVEQVLCDAGCPARRAKALSLYGVRGEPASSECDAQARVNVADLIRATRLKDHTHERRAGIDASGTGFRGA